MKTAASRLGLTEAAYLARLDAGEKWCGHCKAWHPRSDFTRDTSRGDGLSAKCRLRSARRTPGPTKAQRQAARVLGQAWCRRCAAWLPAGAVRAGLCREHGNEQYRENYAASGGAYKRGRAAARRRDVGYVGPNTRALLFEATAGLCSYGCGRRATALDHVIPVARGGITERGNIVPACVHCNSSKRDADPLLWLDRLIPEAVDLILPTATDDGPLLELLVG